MTLAPLNILSVHFASSSEVLSSCWETVSIEPAQEHFFLCIFNHYQHTQLFPCLFFLSWFTMSVIKSIIKLCIVYLRFSTLGRERIQTENSIIFFSPFLIGPILNYLALGKKKRIWLHLSVKQHLCCSKCLKGAWIWFKFHYSVTILLAGEEQGLSVLSAWL